MADNHPTTASAILINIGAIIIDSSIPELIESIMCIQEPMGFKFRNLNPIRIIHAMDSLLPELITLIALECGIVSLFALKYVNKRCHHLIPTMSSADVLMADAAFHGKLSVLSWLISMGCTKHVVKDNTGRICAEAARGNNFAAMKLLREAGFAITYPAANYAAVHSPGIRFIRFIVSNTDWSIELDTLLIAASIGDINLIQWILTEFDAYDDWIEHACCAAASTGKINAIKWLDRERNVIQRFGPRILAHAAFNGHLNLVESVLAKGIEPKHALYGAAAGKQTRVVDWIRARYPKLKINTPTILLSPEYDAGSPDHVLNKYR